MKLDKTKKTICLVSILSLAGGWLQANITKAEARQQTNGEVVAPLFRESSEQPQVTAGNKKVKDVLQILLAIPLTPVAVGLMQGCMILYKITGNKDLNPISK
jgi:hypothetical protein